MEEKIIRTCAECGCVIEDGDDFYEFEGKIYCEDCNDELFEYCPECGEKFYRDDMNWVEGYAHYVCDDCYDDCYSECVNCGEIVRNTEMYDSADGYICEYCAYYNYICCDECGKRVHEDEIHYDEEETRYYCAECFENRPEKVIHNYHHSHSCETKFYGGIDNGTTLFMGLELEIDNGDNRDDTAREMKDCMPDGFITMENDGSLDYGFENITQPATLEYHTSIRNNYEDMFQIAKDNGFRSHNTHTCGYHIHFNRSFFEDKEDECVAKLLYLVEKFWDELVKFSRRNYENLDRWAKKYDKTPDEVVEDMKSHNLDRYHAINLTNRKTIEFRMFRGTLKSETFFATLQLVDTIVRYVKEHTNNDIQSLQFTDLLVTDELKSYWERVKNRGC